jgi:hypothetical protein
MYSLSADAQDYQPAASKDGSGGTIRAGCEKWTSTQQHHTYRLPRRNCPDASIIVVMTLCRSNNQTSVGRRRRT